ncbi:MAG: hypothetical protein KDE19_14965, partial [Caldilineaceae bacterium]|nr:hypothetical protein [Caldilineaceae bacterium]
MQWKTQPKAHQHTHTRHNWRRVFTIVLILGLLAPSFQFSSGGSSPMLTTPQTAKAQIIVDEPTQPTSQTTGLQIALSEGAEQPAAVEQPPLAPAEPLSDETIQTLLDRVPDLEMATGDQVEFRLPEAVLPPPRPGETVAETFPPAEETGAPSAPVESEAGPLEVLRFAPEGDIPIAPFLSV